MSSRIDIRLEQQQKDMIVYASEISGFKSLTDYVLHCLSKESKKVIAEHNTVLKSMADKERFVNALLEPKAPSDSLRKAYASYKEFIDDNEIDI